MTQKPQKQKKFSKQEKTKKPLKQKRKKFSTQKSEICISGIATFRKHSLPTQRKKGREREHVYIRILISTEHHKQLTKKRTLGVIALERQWQNNLPLGV
jgi:hypothetical protein